jgi:hypothetical protein
MRVGGDSCVQRNRFYLHLAAGSGFTTETNVNPIPEFIDRLDRVAFRHHPFDQDGLMRSWREPLRKETSKKPHELREKPRSASLILQSG